MVQSGKEEISNSKVSHLQAKLHIKELQLGALLDITNSINSHFSKKELLEKYKSFLKEQLGIDKLALYSYHESWECILYYGFKKADLAKIYINRDLLHIKEISSLNTQKKSVLADFDIVIPVYQDERPLAYLMLADNNVEELSVSPLIKHLNFLQLLTNIIVTAIEKERMAGELLRKETERRELMEKQNEILEGIVHERTKELRAEKDESERLLYNILPEELAEELKRKGSTTPMRYDEATVLFTDFKNFTLTSAKISPKKLVNELNEIFQAFDFITEKHSIEKIKTIGDSYMAVCGLPRQSEFHAVQVVRAALDMAQFIEHRKKSKDFSWEMRLGVHSGPLVAGVVGTKKFIYDVWGDTVNIASRMESNGVPGKVNVSEKTFQQIKKYFECKYRGKKEAKGKGKMKMYLVESEKESERFLKVKHFIVRKLKKELPKNLYYHGLHHTKDVCDVATGIALKEKIGHKEAELIKVAALFHDAGFIKRYEENEIAGTKLARQFLPKWGYSREEIKIVTGMIIATHTPQKPRNKLEEILADADLDYLGRADFLPIANTLFEELRANGKAINLMDWNKMQISFLKQHKYFTKTSQDLRNRGKQKQLEKLMAETGQE